MPSISFGHAFLQGAKKDKQIMAIKGKGTNDQWTDSWQSGHNSQIS